MVQEIDRTDRKGKQHYTSLDISVTLSLYSIQRVKRLLGQFEDIFIRNRGKTEIFQLEINDPNEYFRKRLHYFLRSSRYRTNRVSSQLSLLRS